MAKSYFSQNPVFATPATRLARHHSEERVWRVWASSIYREMPKKKAGSRQLEAAREKRWEKSDACGSSSDPTYQLPPEDSAEGSDEDPVVVPEVGQEAKRQRHMLSQRRYSERVVGVSRACGAMYQFVIVTPSPRQVEAEIQAAVGQCVRNALSAAVEIIEAEERAAELERQRAQRREAMRRYYCSATGLAYRGNMEIHSNVALMPLRPLRLSSLNGITTQATHACASARLKWLLKSISYWVASRMLYVLYCTYSSMTYSSVSMVISATSSMCLAM